MNRMRAAWGVIGLTLGFIAVSLVVAVVVAAVTVSQIRGDQVTNTQTIDNTAQTLDILLDCTTPEGECYQRGQRSQKDAIGAINANAAASAAAAAVCARQPGNTTYRALYDCILAELEENR